MLGRRRPRGISLPPYLTVVSYWPPVGSQRQRGKSFPSVEAAELLLALVRRPDVAAGFFLRYWRKTAERLFLIFAVAFVLLALNQALGHLLSVVSEPASFVYGLRALAFALILAAIVDQNLSSRR